jgi:hypothetical protein
MDSRGGNNFLEQLGSLGGSFVSYLKTRDAEHWLFFAVGAIIGIVIG